MLLRTSLSARWPLTSELTNSTYGSPCWVSGLRAAFLSWALSVLWFVLWRSSEAIYLLEHTVRILSHRVGHWAGKPLECDFNLLWIQELRDSRLFPWHVGWFCCNYSHNPLVKFLEIHSDKMTEQTIKQGAAFASAFASERLPEIPTMLWGGPSTASASQEDILRGLSQCPC